MNISVKTNLILDITIFTAFLIAANPSLTGNTIHEWLSLAFAAAIIAHLLFHWKWLARVTAEFFKNTFHRSRLNYVVNLLFFIAMTVVMLSGLMISKDIMSFLGIQLDVSRSWKSIHSLTADASIIMIGIHFALHWKWIITTIGRYFVTPIRGLSQPQTHAPKGLIPQRVRIQKEN